MNTSELLKTDLIERLKRVDEDADLLFDDTYHFHMIIVGGGALILLDTISRVTRDIDVLDVSPEICALLANYDINSNVKAYIDSFPYNYEDRLKKIDIDSKKIDFFCVSLEDIVIAKLHSARAKDRQDILDPNVINNIDWDILNRLATADDEAKLSSLNDRNYRDFLSDYEEYVRRCKP